MPQRTKKSERNKKENERKEESASNKVALIPPASQSVMKKNCELKSSENWDFVNLPALFLKDYDIDKEAKKAAKSGNVEEYCKELEEKLEESTNEATEVVIKYVTEFKKQELDFLREEEEREEQGDVDENAESIEAKFESLLETVQGIFEQSRKRPEDREIICNCLTTAVSEDPLVLRRRITEEVSRVIEKVSVAAKALCSKLQVRELNEKSSSSVHVAETAASLEVGGGKEPAKSESNDASKTMPFPEKGECQVQTTSTSVVEAAIISDEEGGEEMEGCESNHNNTKPSITERKENEYNAASPSIDESQAGTRSEGGGGEEMVRCETNDNSSKPSITERKESEFNAKTSSIVESQAGTSSEEGGGEELVRRQESDNSSGNTPITKREDEHVIPTPPPPPPVKAMYRDKVDEINESILGHRRYQVSQVKRELNFAIARLTSEVIMSYEQASALQKQNSPVLEKSIIDFLKNQESKKTFFIKEIAARIHSVLRMLTPEPEVNDPNVELQDLSETVNLLYLLQTTRAYQLDRVSVTTIMNEQSGVLFYLLLLVTVFVIVLALSLNGEWLALIMFVAMIFIFIVKSWQGIFFSRKRKIEVLGKGKKSVKID